MRQRHGIYTTNSDSVYSQIIYIKKVLMLVCSNCGISDSIMCHMELNDIIANVFDNNQ